MQRDVDHWPAADPAAVTTLATGVSGAGGATLATLDTTTLANGSYVIRLQGTDSGGNQLISEILITVAGENKPGRATSSVTDLTVPVTGMPITIGRTYDSLNRDTSGDFGNGWALSLGSPKLETNPAHDVTLTMPDGRRVTFFFTPKSVGGIFGYLLTPGYTPEAGTFGSLTSDGCGLLVSSGGQIICFLAVAYAPTTYTYTDPYGRAYVMSASGSLKSITDLNGNTLTFSASGITSSAGGVSVPFTRDAQGRITQITDPAGKVYSYGYDTAGNLTSVTLPGVTTPVSYTYDAGHLLLSATDPRGHTAVTTTYDARGRLASVTDALGHTTTYTYDLTANTTTITAPDGGVTVNTYDGFGKLIKQVDPLGHTTTFAYDATHNLTLVTDALGHTTSYAYDNNGARITTTDANGHATNYTYDARPAHQDGLRRRHDDAARLRRRGRSDEPHAHRWARHQLRLRYAGPAEDGHLLRWDDGRLQLHTRRPARERGGRARHDHHAYDNQDRVTAITQPDGRSVGYSYDLAGERTGLTTPAGTTAFTYDNAGRLASVAAPGAGTTTLGYDAAGNPTSRALPNGITVSFGYDTLNRLTSVKSVAGTTTLASYTYTLGPAGNRTKVVEADGTAVAWAYDAAYRLISRCPRSLSFLDALRPPMEAGGGADEVAAALEGEAALGLGVLELVEIGKVAVDERRVGQRPQVLGRLRFGGIGRQEEQVDMLRHAQLGARVPPRPIQHEHDLLVWARADLPREGRQLRLEEPDADAGGQVENGAPRGGVHEADQVAPLVAVLDRGGGPLAGEAPDFVQDGVQADAMLVDGPRLDARGGEGRRSIPAELAAPLETSPAQPGPPPARGAGAACSGAGPAGAGNATRRDRRPALPAGRPAIRLRSGPSTSRRAAPVP